MSNNDLPCNKCKGQHHPADECGYRVDWEKQCKEIEKELNRMDKKFWDALTLIDGAYEIVELWDAESPFNKRWKNNWLKEARKLGASGE